jgi:adenosine/AMP kinase
MPDDKTKTDTSDRMRIAGGEEYEVQYLAKKHGIAVEEAKTLIRRHGNDRKMIDEAVKKLTGAG